ncbi:MAG TPA: GLUG motif-containing protein [archaeon]|nr:GLUG motif-containing protein [archaeon]
MRCFSRQRADGWLPIGDYEDLFSGSFNGNNHKISNLYISDSDGVDLGLFGYFDAGEISNLGLEDLNISGKLYLGGLVGEMDSGEITNCYTTGNIYELSGGGRIGGIVGGNWGGYITNSYSETNIYAGSGDFYYGGLIGNNNGDVENCYATGFVSGRSYVGGLIGANFGGSITNSYATGDVNVLNTYADAGGGFIGDNEGTISNSYSFGDVTRVTGSNTTFGGFTGYNGGTITKSYSTGRVIYAGTTNPTNRGFSFDSVSNNNFWDTQTSLQATSGGGALGKTTAEMKTPSTYTDWDFITVWAIHPSKNNGYPYLRWQN